MFRALLALPLALLMLATPARAESAKAHVAAARRAASKRQWNKALSEWQAAYRMDSNSDDLLGMGDAYAAMGDKANARKQYNAYLADPLALDTDGAKAKLAALDKPSNNDLGLDLDGPPKATAKNDDLDLDLSGPSKPAPKNKTVASNKDLDLDFGSAKPPPKKAANDDLSLDFTPPPAKTAAKDDLSLDFGPPAKTPPPPPAKVASKDDLSLDFGPPTKVATANPPAAVVAPPPARYTAPPPARSAPVAIVTPPPARHNSAPPPAVYHAPPPRESVLASREPVVVEHNNRVIAYCTGALAIGALAVGGLYYTKASQNQTDLTSSIRPGSQQQALIEQQKTNKSLALAGIVTGVILAGVTTAIFVF